MIRSRSAELVLLLLCFLLASCAHSVRLISVPSGAKVYVNGKEVGETPMLYRDRSGVMARKIEMKAELPGRNPVVRKESVHICPTPGNLIMDTLVAGFFFGFCLQDEYVFDFTASTY